MAMAVVALCWSASGAAAGPDACRQISHGAVRNAGPDRSPWRAAPVHDGARIADAAALAMLPRPAIVVDVDLPGADFGGIDLSGLCFAGGDLSGSRWMRAEGVALIGVDASGARWQSARLAGALLIDANLDGVDARGVRLDDATIAGGALGLDLAGAHLSRVHVRCGTDMADGHPCGGERPARLAGAAFTAAVFDGAIPPGWTLARARLDGITIGWDSIDSLAGASPQGATTVVASGYRADRRVRLSLRDVALTIAGMTRSARDEPGAGPPPLRPGARLLYVDSDRSSAAFRRTALWRRLLPVIAGSARAWLTVSVADPRHLTASAHAIDGHGRMCDLGDASPEALTRGRGGWFYRTVRTAPPDIDDNRGPLLRFTADQAEFRRYDADCAENSDWGTLRYLTDDPALVGDTGR